MKRMWMLTVLMVGIGLLPLASEAGEHGGREHGGQEHGGAAVSGGSHTHDPAEAAATLREAAEALRATRPDLAEKLEHLAESYE